MTGRTGGSGEERAVSDKPVFGRDWKLGEEVPEPILSRYRVVIYEKFYYEFEVAAEDEFDAEEKAWTEFEHGLGKQANSVSGVCDGETRKIAALEPAR